MSATLDGQEILVRILKYLLEGIVVGFAAYFIPKSNMNLDEAIMIALTAAATFSVLDLLAPAVGTSIRQGVGYGFGFNLAGFPR
jgi:hypothetical protein